MDFKSMKTRLILAEISALVSQIGALIGEMRTDDSVEVMAITIEPHKYDVPSVSMNCFRGLKKMFPQEGETSLRDSEQYPTEYAVIFAGMRLFELQNKEEV